MVASFLVCALSLPVKFAADLNVYIIHRVAPPFHSYLIITRILFFTPPNKHIHTNQQSWHTITNKFPSGISFEASSKTEQALTTLPTATKASTHLVSLPLPLRPPEQRVDTHPHHTHSQAVSPLAVQVSGDKALITTADQGHGEDEAVDEAAIVVAATNTTRTNAHLTDLALALALTLPTGNILKARLEKDLHTAQEVVMDTDTMAHEALVTTDTKAHVALDIMDEDVEDGADADAEVTGDPLRSVAQEVQADST